MRNVELQVPLRVYTRSGALIAQIGEQRRIPVTYDQIPELVKHAFLAAEDERFFEHGGIDYFGVVRAVLRRPDLRRQDPGRQHHHHAGRAQHVPDARQDRAPQAAGDLRHLAHGARVHQAGDLRPVPERDLLRPARLRRRRRGRGLLRQDASTSSTSPRRRRIAGVPKAPSRYNPIVDPQLATCAPRLRAAAHAGAALHRRGHRRGRQQGADAGARARAALRRRGARTSPRWRAWSCAQRFGPSRRERRLQGLHHHRRAPADGCQPRRARRADRVRPPPRLARARRPRRAAGARRAGLRGPGRRVRGDRQPRRRRSSTSVRDKSARAYVQPLRRGADRLGRDCPGRASELRNETLGPAPKDAAPGARARRRRLRGRRRRTGTRSWRRSPRRRARWWRSIRTMAAIVALVGGFDYFTNKYNRVTQARRLPGSGFKPFLYSAALEHGFTPASVILDAPIVLDGNGIEDTWRPENSTREFGGPTRLREALVRSRNLVSIRMLQRARHRHGDRLHHALRLRRRDAAAQPDAGARHAWRPRRSRWPPATRCSPTAATACSPYFIERIENAAGPGRVARRAAPRLPAVRAGRPPRGVPREAAAEAVRTADDQHARAARAAAAGRGRAARHHARRTPTLMDDMMADVIKRGTGRRALALDRSDIAGKTGTTNEAKDTWFNGFTPNLVATVWVGFDQERPLGEAEEGARTALPIWIGFMREALKGVAEQHRADARRPRDLAHLARDRHARGSRESQRAYRRSSSPTTCPRPGRRTRVTGPAGPGERRADLLASDASQATSDRAATTCAERSRRKPRASWPSTASGTSSSPSARPPSASASPRERAAAEEQRDRGGARRLPAPVRRRLPRSRRSQAQRRAALARHALPARVRTAAGRPGALRHRHRALRRAAAPVRRARRSRSP